MNLKNSLLGLCLSGLLGSFSAVHAADYLIDTKDAHAFIQFKISHLGYSWVLGSLQYLRRPFQL